MSIGQALGRFTITAAVIAATSTALTMSWVSPAFAAPPKTQYGENWSGLIHQGNATAVGAVFNVAQLTCPPPSEISQLFFGVPISLVSSWSEAVQWVGLGGVATNDPLLQAGIHNQCFDGKQASYLTWDNYPAVSEQVESDYRAFPGDPIAASVTYNGDTKGFALSVRDLSASHGWYWSKAVHQSERNVPQSAEWIVESPGTHLVNPLGFPSRTLGNFLFGPPLANFGTVHFSLCSFAPGFSGGHLLTDADGILKVVTGTQSDPGTAVSDVMGTTSTFTVKYIHS